MELDKQHLIGLFDHIEERPRMYMAGDNFDGHFGFVEGILYLIETIHSDRFKRSIVLYYCTHIKRNPSTNVALKTHLVRDYADDVERIRMLHKTVRGYLNDWYDDGQNA